MCEKKDRTYKQSKWVLQWTIKLNVFHFPLVLPLSCIHHSHTRRAKEATFQQKGVKATKNIDEELDETIRTYLNYRSIKILDKGWTYDSDRIGFNVMDAEGIVFVDDATKYGSYDMPKEEPDQGTSGVLQRPTSKGRGEEPH